MSRPSSSSSLGTLSHLPPEIRLCIYEQALQSGSLPSLMRTSRALNAEIKPRLYDTVDIHLKPDVTAPFMSITFNCLPGAEWTLDEEQACINPLGKLAKLPVNKIKRTRINIYAPDPSKRGQLLYLWVKVEDLVDVLLKHRTLKHLKHTLNLVPYKGHTWTTAQEVDLARTHADFLRKPTPVFPYLRSPLTPRWDIDFFWIPFARLYKDPKRRVRLSDGSVCVFELVMESVLVWWHRELEKAEGKEADLLRFRRTTMRVIKYMNGGGVWPWVDLEFMKEAEMPLPGVIRGLLGS